MPAINSEVPIGYRINGDEMLSFMPTTGEGLAHLVPKAGSALLMVARTCVSSFWQAVRGTLDEPGLPVWDAAYPLGPATRTETLGDPFNLCPIDRRARRMPFRATANLRFNCPA